MPPDREPLGSAKATTDVPGADDVTTTASSFAAAAGPGSLFHRGELIAGRFKIVRVVGQGGMGTVYEAEDQELGGHVALKTVHPQLTTDRRMVERFKQEIYLARKVTHPNVCRIFDLFHHRPSALEDEIVFLTMELLQGETLAQRLQRTGRIDTAEALPLVSDMTAALTAAHQASIVHRDFKPSNVVLVPSHDKPGDVRAVVTDFGLAHSSGEERKALLSLTGTRDVLGTPAYMAPEQLSTEETTAATDIYALGVVMYKMVAGQRPFAGDTPISEALQRLQRPAASPRGLVADLNPRWEATILRCLERDPADRFASAADVCRALVGEQVEPRRGVGHRRRWIAGVAMILVIAAAVGGWRFTRHEAADSAIADSAGAAIRPRRSVAVLSFRNLSGRPDVAWLSTALSEMLTSELGAGEKLRMIPGEQVVRVRMDLAAGDAEGVAADTLTRIRTNLGTDVIVVGSYLAVGGTSGSQIRVDLRVQDAKSGEIIAAVTETGTEAELLTLVSRLGSVLRDRLGVGELSASQASGMRASLPSDPVAARAYADGLAQLRRSENLAARDLLLKAVAAEPGYPLAHSALAAAWSALGYDTRAADAAKRAFDLSEKLSREERLSIEGQYRLAAAQVNEATEIFRTLFKFFPDDLDYGLRLAEVQINAGRGKDALATVDDLRRLPAPMSEDVRIDLTEAAAAGSLSDFQREQTAATRAAEKAAGRDAPILLALAHMAQGDAYVGLGDPQKAIASFGEAQRIYAESGDRGGAASALGRIGGAHQIRGDLAVAGVMTAQALATYRDIGNRRAVANTAASLGIVMLRQGKLPEARTLFVEALTAFREIGNKVGEARALNGVANVLREQGDFDQARTLYSQVLTIAREIGQKSYMATALSNIANVHEDQGDLAAARQANEESLAVAREIGEKDNVTRIARNLAGVVGKQGDLAKARQLFEESLAMSRDVGNKRNVARGLSSLGDIELYLGDLAAATKRYDEALAISRDVGEKADLAVIKAQLGNVLLAQARFAEARQQHDEAMAIRQAIGQKRIEPDSDLDLARLAIEEGRFKDGERLAGRAATAFRSQQAPGEAAALAVVADALLAQARPAEAQRAIDRAMTVSRSTQNVFIRIPLAITSARIGGASGKPPGPGAAVEHLKTILAETDTLGLFTLQLEARLALGALELAGVNPAAGRDRLAELESYAGEKGFGLIARKARAARAAR